MTGVGDTPRTFDEYIRWTNKRLVALERQIATRASSSGGGGGGGSTGGITTITEGPGIDITGGGTSSSPMVISAESTTLPDPIRPVRASDTNTITATGVFAETVSGLSAPVVLARRCWVLVTAGAWLIANTSGTETRVGIELTGATVMSATVMQNGQTAWGQNMIATFVDIAASSVQRTIQRTLLLEAGTTNVILRAYKLGTGTSQVNYPVLEITPLRWAN